MTHATHAALLILIVALALGALIGGTMFFGGKGLRAQLATRSNGSRRVAAPDSSRPSVIAAIDAVPPRSSPPPAQGLARMLTERGLVDTQQLAGMSPAEREFFFTTVAAKLGDGSKPRLVRSPGIGDLTGAPAPGAAPAAALAAERTAPPGDSAESPLPRPPLAPLPPPPLPQAALVSGPIHCPVCRTVIGQRAEGPLQMSRCPGCSRRVGVRVEGDRLTVTVDYSLGTPASGTPKIKP